MARTIVTPYGVKEKLRKAFDLSPNTVAKILAGDDSNETKKELRSAAIKLGGCYSK